MIKEIRTLEKIEQALELYDTVVLPMDLNTNLAFLGAIPDKSRIRLFSNGGCAHKCPLKVCYKSISKINKYKGDTLFQCSQDMLYRPFNGMVDFDVARLQELGFSKFKLLRSKGKTAY